MRALTIATRGSQLALWQANHVRERLVGLDSSIKIQLKIIKTRGDKILDVPLAKVGGKGLFVKEIEEALLNQCADLAVHSIKDVPMELPETLVLGCVPKREVFTDCLLSEKFTDLHSLPQGAKIGTSSLRRQSQLLALRRDLKIEPLRGNIDTRLRKLREGKFDAILLASAGLVRLGLTATHMTDLDPDEFVPAVGQGALGIECRAKDEGVLELLHKLEDRETRVCVEAERGFLAGLNGGCQVPIGAHAQLEQDNIILDGLVAEVDGSAIFREQMRASATNARSLGLKLADTLRKAGAGEILARLYGQGDVIPQS